MKTYYLFIWIHCHCGVSTLSKLPDEARVAGGNSRIAMWYGQNLKILSINVDVHGKSKDHHHFGFEEGNYLPFNKIFVSNPFQKGSFFH